jgi:hydrogenase maturation protein HypF
MAQTNIPPPLRRTAIVVRGVVQGVGFRPFVYNAARSWGLAGWVLNEADLVRIEVQGNSDQVTAFLEAIKKDPPAQAKFDSLEIRDIPCSDDQSATFEIRTSSAAASPGPTIPADLATCADCLAEILDPRERRHGYPFTNCTNCGPRWSIIEQLPYDRQRTSMKSFAMCESCRVEYENPADRRFHAQPIACPTCGPHLQLLDPQGRNLLSPDQPSVGTLRGAGGEDRCITDAANAVCSGKILALKGIGGFQLIADATNAEAVALLRERKHRPDRPFALMMRSFDEVRRYCVVSDEEAKMIASHQAPIVLLKLHSANNIQDLRNIAPGNPYLGIMLPYTPLHHLLMAAIDRPIVCTSGNLSEEPMAISIEDALQRLGRIADLFLTHDRPIVRPVDDSIVRFGPTGMQVLRRARGFAPLPITVRNPHNRTILALGGHLKNTIALCLRGGKTVKAEGVKPIPHSSISIHHSPLSLPPSPLVSSPTIISAHVGDLDTAASVEVFRKAIDDLVQFYLVRPNAVVCDLHPDYASTRQAETLAARWNVPLLRVQHHHAHVAACMAEHDLAGPVLGFAWDGTGYGTDGTIWGGEAILCTASRGIPIPGLSTDFTRAAHLRTFPLPGGDATARQPRRSALGLLYEIFGEKAAKYAESMFPPSELGTLMQMLRRGTNCPRTSSLGRLFDAVAAIAGISPKGGGVTFEGQAAMTLEFIAEAAYSPLPKGEGTGVRAYPFPLQKSENGTLITDWEPMIREILADLSSGEPVGQISLRFHNALADLAVDIAITANIHQIVLTGGCFQNALLLRLTHSRLIEAGFQVFHPQQLPPGDGGIALGQIFIAGFKPTIG